MFKLKHLGHAGWVVRNKEFKAICDPWFDPAGAFFSAWFPFPDNSDLLTNDLVRDLDVVYISHSHQDHFDPWFLKRIHPSTSIVIPKFSDRLLFKKLKNLGFKNIVQLSEDEYVSIKGVKMRIIIEDKMIEKDSGIIFDDGVNTVLNLNDCHPEYGRLKKFAPKVDILLLQSSSAIWWPCVYEYDDEKMKSYGRLKRTNVMNRSLRYVQKLSPRLVVPNAGPPAFLYDDASYWDSTRREEHNPFVLQDEIHDFFLKNNVPSAFVIPGSEIVVSEDIIVDCDEEEKSAIYNDLDSYIAKYKERREPHFMNLKATPEELRDLTDNFKSFVQDIAKKSLVFKYKVEFPFLVDLDHLGKWIINFNEDQKNCFKKYDGSYYNYNFKFNPDIVAILFREKSVDFEDYLLSMRFKCNRKMDEFNEFLFAIFKNFDVKRLVSSEMRYLNNTQKINDDETFLIKDNNGDEIEVKRYCPHKHVDLKECGYVNDHNELVCPLHGWKFNLQNGKCTNQSGNHNILK